MRANICSLTICNMLDSDELTRNGVKLRALGQGEVLILSTGLDVLQPILQPGQDITVRSRKRAAR